jgi:FeS assembly SUF system protein
MNTDKDKEKISLPQSGVSNHADAVARQKLGRSIADMAFEAAPLPAANAALPKDQQVLELKIIGELQKIFDPEIPLNIYDLGLIYKIKIAPTNAVTIDMTLTAPGCPVAGDIVREVKTRVEAIAEVPACVVNLVWDPPWSRESLSEAAKLQLGLM